MKLKVQLAALAMESVSMDGAFATHIGLVLHAPSLPRTSLLQSVLWVALTMAFVFTVFAFVTSALLVMHAIAESAVTDTSLRVQLILRRQ